MAMSIRQSLNSVLDRLPEERLAELLDFAEFLESRQGRETWSQATRQRFAEAYGPDEPDYTEADVKPAAAKP
jgi:hypothetical protein